MYKRFVRVSENFNKYLSVVPVLGFNSAKYDLNLIKSQLAKHLKLHLKKENPYIVMKNNSYMQIQSSKFKFLDISNFLAPVCSYSKFLKMYEIEEQKSFFPYDYLSHEDILEETELPCYDAFFSKI